MLTPIAFAMGGSPPPQYNRTAAVDKISTSETMLILSANGTSSCTLESLKDDYASLEVQSEVYYGCLKVIIRKMIETKTAGDTVRLAELIAMERSVSDQACKVDMTMASMIKKYPTLKPTEEAAMGVAGMIIASNKAEKRSFGKPAAAVPPKNGKPNKAKKPVMTAIAKKSKPDQTKKIKIASKKLIYHTVARGETLMGISRKYFKGSGSYYKKIAQMSGIIQVSQLKVGERLKIDLSLLKKKESYSPRL
jgi:LysM domain